MTARRGLSPADFALVRAIVKWRREAPPDGYPRVTFSANRAWGHFLTWTEDYPVPIAERREVAVEVVYAGSDDPEDYPHQLRLCWTRKDHRAVGAKFTADTEPASVREAVDILVAVGFLPPRFSSAYRAGWDAHHRIGTPIPNSEVLTLMPANRETR